jgi:DNA invertase Pin-like site-specific DNA recombinase
MKYFIYCRKSTDSEERQVLSIEAQLAELKEFVARFSSPEIFENPRNYLQKILSLVPID